MASSGGEGPAGTATRGSAATAGEGGAATNGGSAGADPAGASPTGGGAEARTRRGRGPAARRSAASCTLADVWSCGVTLYVMLVGAYPFEDPDDPKNIRKTIQQIMEVQYNIPDYVHISKDCKQLIARIFVANPMRRITMKEIKSHPWFLKNLPLEITEMAQAMYYKRDNRAPSYSDQMSEEIMKIVQDARIMPKSSRSGYGWGNECSDEEEEQEEEHRAEKEEDGYDRSLGGSRRSMQAENSILTLYAYESMRKKVICR